MDALPPAPRVALRPPEPAPGEPEEISGGIAELRTVGEALTRAPVVYEDAGKPRRAAPPPVPPPPPRYRSPEEPPAFAGIPTRPPAPVGFGGTGPSGEERGTISLGTATVRAERARLEQVRQLLTALVERVTDRLSALAELGDRLDRVQEELKALNEVSHSVQGENDALLDEIREALGGLTGAEGTSPEPVATATPPPAPTP